MDVKYLTKQREELAKEVAILKSNPSIPLSSIIKLVDLELTLLKEILQKLGENDLHMDLDGSEMIDRVSNEFRLKDAASVKWLSYKLVKEFETMILCFHPQSVYIANLVLKVINCLDLKVSLDLRGQMNSVGGISQDSKKATDAQGSDYSPEPSITLAHRTLEWTINITIGALMMANPQGFKVDQVFELLRRTRSYFNIYVPDPDTQNLIISRYNEAMNRDIEGDKDKIDIQFLQ